MQPEDQDQAAHSVPAPESVNEWAMPSADPAQTAQTDAYPAAPQPYQYPPLQANSAWPVPPGPSPVPAKPAKRGRTIGLVVGVVVMLVVFGVVTALLSSNKPSPASNVSVPLPTTTPVLDNGSSAQASSAAPTTSAAPPAMSLPASGGGLVLLTTSQVRAEADRVRLGVETSDAYNNALVGAYGKRASGDYNMVLVIQPITNLSGANLADFMSVSPLDAVSMIANGAKMTDVTVESPSDPSAAMSCGTLTASNTSVLTCVWDDGRGFGLGYFFTATSKADAARYTDALRAAAEAG